MTMPESATAAQLATLISDISAVKTDVAVILERTGQLADHEQRIRALEGVRSRLGAMWAAAVAFGAVIGWLASYLSGHK